VNIPITPAIILALLAAASWFIFRWQRLARQATRATPAKAPSVIDVVIGFVSNFFDTLGIGSFASTTAAFKVFERIADEEIPGTLNVGHALPVILQALIFISIISVEPVTLFSMICAAIAGAWFGGEYVSKLPRRAIQLGMGLALLCAAVLFLVSLLGLTPTGGDAEGLGGVKLAVAVGASFILGGLMMLGVGLYAPCLILVSLFGMNPVVAFPIMMGSCAFLMPVGGARFIESGSYNFRAALGLTLGGLPAVLIAAYIVKSLPLDWLRWLVIIVVTYAAVSMLWSARRSAKLSQT